MMNNFWTRTVSAVVYVLLFVVVIYSGALLNNNSLGTLIFGVFMLFVGCGCTFEFYRIVAQQGATPSRWVGYVGLVLMLLAINMLFMDNLGELGELIPMMPTLILIILLAFPLSVVLQLWKHSNQPFRDAAYSVVPIVYIGLPLMCMSVIQAEKANALMMLLIIVWMNDNGAYMGGSLFGKHKMWVRHSPGKTWEGTIIGVVVATLTAALVGPLMCYKVVWWHWGVTAVLCSVAATLGDLVESMLKRSVGMKDSGKIMPGHGGFLDRFDSLLIATPVYLICVVTFF